MEKENIKDRLQQYEDTLRNVQKEMKERTEYLLQQTAQMVNTSRSEDAAQQAGVSRMVARLSPYLISVFEFALL
jgi:polyphosphate kinase 2 (PPK2 family)